MECPNCKHATNGSALLQCSHCGEAFERGPLEEFQHLNYLADWIRDRPEIAQKLKQQLLDLVGKKQDMLRKQLLPKIPEKAKPVETKPAPAPVLEAKPISEKPMPAAVQAEAKSVPAPAPIVKPAPVSAPAPRPRPAPKPAAPAKPKRPPIDWRKVITEAATSGALLRALLYLGAFMIVISATVLVIRFWNEFHPIVQLLFIGSVPLTFYAGGWALRIRLKLIQAGTVLTGIGALLVVVDFAAIYQLGGVGQNNGPLYWLIVSIFCTALYAFTAWRLQGEFFDYLPLLGGASVLFTFTRFLRLPAEWSVVSITIAGTLMTMLAIRYLNARDHWREFARAARYLSQILIPASLFYVIFAPAMPLVAQMTGFLFATVGYFVLARQFPSFIFAYAALGASIGTVLFALRVADLSIEWYSTVAAILAIAYILIGQRVQKAKLEPDIIQKYISALNTTGFLLLSIAAAGGLVTSFSSEVWAGVIAMVLASLDLAICAYLFRRSRYTLLASGLFIAPFSIAILEWIDILQTHAALGVAWLAFAWSALALTYIGLGAVLQKVEKHNRWLYAWAHILTPIALFILPFSYLLDASNWTSGPALVPLGMAIFVYVISFILQDSGRHSSFSAISSWLPYGLGKSIFLWPIGLLLPIWVAVAWYATNLPDPWFGATLTSLGLAYIGVGQLLLKRTAEYRLPFHFFTYLLCVAGIYISAPDSYSLLTALLVTVISAGVIAYLYNRVVETIIASILFIWPFQLSLDILNIPYYAQTLGYTLLAGLAYIPVAIYLNKFQKSREKFHHVPLFSVGYALVAYAVIESVIVRGDKLYIPWVGVAVPLLATALFIFSTSYFRESKYSPAWAWAGMLTFTIAFGQALTLFKAPTEYNALAWVGLAAFYVIAERTLFFTSQKQTDEIQRFWYGMFHLPVMIYALALTTLGLALSLPDTLNAFVGIQLQDYLPPILAQVAVVMLAIASARLYQGRWQLFIEPFLAFLPATLFFIGYGKQIFGQALTLPQYALIWTGLGIIHVLAGTFVDRAKVRYAHGLYLGGYVLFSWAVLWSVFERSTLVWTLGLWILTSIGSALLVHFRRHQTWDEFLHLLFGKSKGFMQTTARNVFQWLAAWAFPIWCVIFLREMGISESFSCLGLVIPPLAYLGLALWFRRVDSAYATSLISAAQFYTVIGLLISAPTTFDFLINYNVPDDNRTLPAFILLQAASVIFYAFSGWMFKSRGFAHISAWLSISAFSMAWLYSGIAFTPIMLVLPWLIWSAVLLLLGYTLDKDTVRYSHGPYLAGYVLMFYALARSTEIRITNIYALAITILLTLISHLVLHFGRHHSFEDFFNSFWKKADGTTQKIVSTIFLFFASYATPILLAQILTYNDYPVAWRGVWLAIAAPLYIAIGLLIAKAKPRSSLPLVPTWALYSAGYALTAIGALVAFEDEMLATYVLALNTVIYAVSAYIFRQAFWLYLSTVLTPIIALLVLHQTDRLESTWVAWIFIVLAYIYLGVGQLFDRMKKAASSDIHPFAAPFYMPGFVLSVIALAVAGSEKTLAIQIYSAAVVLYAISAWFFRETLFIYLTAWLAAVPYYLAITLTPLETRWYGLAWLPLIIIYIAMGRIFFHKQALAPLGKGALVQWVIHPAIPFYLMAYALSIGMISLSYTNPLALTLAFTAAMILYLTSAFLFRTPAWIYAGLLAAHMALLTYFTIDPQGGEPYQLSYPFHALTWLMALLGYGLSRWITAAGSSPARSDAKASEDEMQGFSWLDHVLDYLWARPFFIFAVMDIIVWQFVALNSYHATITLAIGHALLLVLFSILWTQGSLVYGAVSFSLLAVGASLKQAQVPFGDSVAVFGGIGFGLYLLARVFEPISSRFKPLTVWLTPLTHFSIFLTTAAVIVNLPLVERQMTATAVSLALAGALYITIAYRERQYWLGYLGMALLEVAWAILLYMNEIRQPQFYAIPGGLYFLGIAYLEMQLGRKRYAVAIEMLGLGVLLVTSFAQSLNGETGLAYFVLLMVEALLVIWWGVLQKRKIPFFTGIGASAINIAAQVIILISVHDIHRVNRWLVAFGAGIIITGIAIIAEHKREKLRAYSRQVSEMLEKWE
ncbi:MAG: hypothetical protein L0287_26600 [Anaerolineae bacterium]|nr:hypothetical protein [Anaerolineae bacterium]